MLTNRELPKTSERLDLEQLPIDILLLTVKDCELLACLSLLTGFSRMFQKDLGVKLGDVVISEVLITYAPSKVTKDGIEERGDRVPLKPNLAKVILNAAAGWSAPLRDPAELEVAQVRGALLSGPQVVDDSDLREALLNRFPGAIAIEMEGEGKVK